MPATPKQNWRYPMDRWMALEEKLGRLGINRSVYLTAMCDLALAETDEQTRDRLELWNEPHNVLRAEHLSAAHVTDPGGAA